MYFKENHATTPSYIPFKCSSWKFESVDIGSIYLKMACCFNSKFICHLYTILNHTHWKKNKKCMVSITKSELHTDNALHRTELEAGPHLEPESYGNV